MTSDSSFIGFNRPFLTGKEFAYMRQAVDRLHLSGNGEFTRLCHSWLERQIGCHRTLLTTSCTTALEMSALLIDVQPGDEVIMPSYTFTSTANAFVLRGGVPVFIDVRPDTFCLDEQLIEAAITSRTKAIVVVHYAGVSCEMDTILALARRHNLFVIEDAAQSILASYKGRPLGSLGTLAALSFHETKNIIAGEGGALLINDQRWAPRAEVLRDKGTNRQQFDRGEVQFYEWVDVGSSYLPSELTAAFLWAQLEDAAPLTQQRLAIWKLYHDAFAALERRERLRRPIVPADCTHNGHLYYLLLPNFQVRKEVLAYLSQHGVNAVFHYVPLHTAPAGRKYGRAVGTFLSTQRASECLIRLPLWIGMSPQDVARVVEVTADALTKVQPTLS